MKLYRAICAKDLLIIKPNFENPKPSYKTSDHGAFRGARSQTLELEALLHRSPRQWLPRRRASTITRNRGRDRLPNRPQSSRSPPRTRVAFAASSSTPRGRPLLHHPLPRLSPKPRRARDFAASTTSSLLRASLKTRSNGLSLLSVYPLWNVFWFGIFLKFEFMVVF